MAENNAFLRVSVLALFSIVVVPGPPAHSQSADEALNAAFTDAYSAYTTAVESGNDDAALQAAKLAHELGIERYGRESRNYAALLMNYGQMLALTANAELAAQIYEEAAAVYAVVSGQESQERADALMALAEVLPNYDSSRETVESALNILRSELTDDDVAFARMQIHGAEILATAKLDSTDATQLYVEALSTLENTFGDDSIELVPTLMALGVLELQGKLVRPRRMRRFERALEIVAAAEPDNVAAVADLELRIAQVLSRNVTGGELAFTYVESAADRLSREFGQDHPQRATAAFVYGDALIANGDFEAGIEQIEEAIQYFDGKPEYESNLRLARRRLIRHFARIGDDERYDEQILAFALLADSQGQPDEYLPIIKVAPRYPMDAAIRGDQGYVVVQFTVDERGRTQDLIVVESDGDRSSGEVFEDAALRAAEQFLYVPRFVNGEPVSVPEVRNKITFQME